ncbi:MAG: MFS transporter [Sporomusaceae bacterium]|nr:MFS transporter [Sporomusaceae bacterium]
MRSNIGPRMDRLPISKWHYKVLWLMGLGLFVDSFDNYMGGVILADLVKSGWSNNYLNATFVSATMGGLFIGSLLAGFTGDHLGRKFAYQVNLLIFGLASIAAGFATDMTMLIVLRGIMGIGLGAELVVGFGTFPEFVPAKVRGKWTSLLSLVANSAPPIAILVAYLVMPIWGWRAMFLIGGVAALIVWAMRHGLPESPRWYEARGDLAKADAILTEIEQEIEREKGIKLPPVEAVESGSGQTVKDISFWSLFKGVLLRRTIVASTLLIGMNTVIYTIINWVPTIFIQSGISVTKSTGMMSLIMLGAPLGVLIASQVVDRFPRKWLAVALLLVIGSLGYVYSLQRTETFIVILGFILAIVIYIYTCFVCSVYAPEIWPTEARLRGLGFANAVGRVSAIFSPYGVAWILSNYGAVAVFIALGLILVLVAVIIATLGIETRHKSLEDIGREAGM